MAKFYGPIGYAETKETRPGVFQEIITERNYAGDVLRKARRLESGETINDNISVNNSLSIIADPYAYQHFFAIRYCSAVTISFTFSAAFSSLTLS